MTKQTMPLRQRMIEDMTILAQDYFGDVANVREQVSLLVRQYSRESRMLMHITPSRWPRSRSRNSREDARSLSSGRALCGPVGAFARPRRTGYQLRGAATGGGPSPTGFFGFSVPT
jgi:hypothetical protein